MVLPFFKKMKFIPYIVHYCQEEQLNLEKSVFILPNIRAKKYLEQAWMEQASTPLLAPQIYTIDQWIKRLSPHPVVPKIHQIFRLFEVHLQLLQADENRTFDAFLQWAPTLLSDIDEIERNQVAANDLFKNLADIRDIEKWSPEGEPLTEAQENYLKFWDRLKDYYHLFRERMRADQVLSAGMAYRLVAERLFELLDQHHPDQHFLFCGFNALSQSEMSIMNRLRQANRATILWDTDEYYLSAPYHEAGSFFRHWQTTTGSAVQHRVLQQLRKESKKVEVIKCTQQIAQVHAAATLLNQLSPSELANTLLLMADENLLTPLLQNIPKSVGSANISMGISLQQTPMQLWVNLLFSIAHNQRKFRLNNTFYYKDLFTLWRHPYFKWLIPAECEQMQQELEQNVVQFNSMFVGLQRCALNNAEWEQFYKSLQWQQQSDLNQQLEQWHQMAIDISKKCTDDRYHQAVLKAFDEALRSFQNLWPEENAPEIDVRTFQQLFNQHISGFALAFEGNPTEGLQIMGLLETRLLDFETLIVIGLNEGNLPPGNPLNTLIPFDLRKAHGLPGPREKTALFAHHFYRLLHFAKNVKLIYSETSDDFSYAEPSRYLLQLEKEWTRQNRQVDWKEKTFSLPEDHHQTPRRRIEKSPVLQDRMRSVLGRSLSASAINTYLRCSLNFYYKYLVGLGEEEKVEEEIEANTLGSIIHETLENLFKPHALLPNGIEGERVKQEPLSVAIIDKMMVESKRLLKQSFLKAFGEIERSLQTGKNFLSYQVAEKMIENLLSHERHRVKTSEDYIFIHSLEGSFKKTYSLNVHGNQQTFHLNGKIDRINLLVPKNAGSSEVGDRLEVVDYKSGKLKEDDVRLTNPNQIPFLDLMAGKLRSTSTNLDKINQMIIYAILVKHHLGVLPETIRLISMVNNKDADFSLQVGDFTLQEIVQQDEAFVQLLLDHLLDPEMPFEHASSQTYYNFCTYCD